MVEDLVEAPLAPAAPAWLGVATLRLARARRAAAAARGRPAHEATEAARDVLVARHPALPMTMITEALVAAVGTAEG